jgi:hypothetical protein
MLRFTIRDLVLMMSVVALGVGWIAERKPLISQNAYLRQQSAVLLDLLEKHRLQAEHAEEMREIVAQESSTTINELQREIRRLKNPPNEPKP